MQTIPEQYKQAGHAMRLVRREGVAAIFKAVGADYWEVHRVRVRKAEHKFGKDYPEREVLAGNEDFGNRFFIRATDKYFFVDAACADCRLV